MLQARYTPMKLKDEEIKTYADDISITPLAIPMLCGPGAIANAIVLMEDSHTIEMKSVLILSLIHIYFEIDAISYPKYIIYSKNNITLIFAKVAIICKTV